MNDDNNKIMNGVWYIPGLGDIIILLGVLYVKEYKCTVGGKVLWFFKGFLVGVLSVWESYWVLLLRRGVRRFKRLRRYGKGGVLVIIKIEGVFW